MRFSYQCIHAFLHIATHNWFYPFSQLGGLCNHLPEIQTKGKMKKGKDHIFPVMLPRHPFNIENSLALHIYDNNKSFIFSDKKENILPLVQLNVQCTLTRQGSKSLSTSGTIITLELVPSVIDCWDGVGREECPFSFWKTRRNSVWISICRGKIGWTRIMVQNWMASVVELIKT